MRAGKASGQSRQRHAPAAREQTEAPRASASRRRRGRAPARPNGRSSVASPMDTLEARPRVPRRARESKDPPARRRGPLSSSGLVGSRELREELFELGLSARSGVSSGVIAFEPRAEHRVELVLGRGRVAPGQRDALQANARRHRLERLPELHGGWGPPRAIEVVSAKRIHFGIIARGRIPRARRRGPRPPSGLPGVRGPMIRVFG